jgi:FkbM family methyltransferase
MTAAERGIGCALGGQRVLPAGVIHVGGHHGEEASYYEAHGVRQVVWFEAEPDAFAVLRANVGGRPGHDCIQALVGDRDGEERAFYRHRFPGGEKRGFCSTLPWNTSVVAGDPVLSRLETFDVASMQAVTVASALRARGYAPEQFQYLSINVQGAELMVLRGLHEYLRPVRWVFWEAELDAATSRYAGAPVVADVAAWLAARGFQAAPGQGMRQQLFYRPCSG